MENTIKIDDLGVPLFLETPKSIASIFVFLLKKTPPPRSPMDFLDVVSRRIPYQSYQYLTYL